MDCEEGGLPSAAWSTAHRHATPLVTAATAHVSTAHPRVHLHLWPRVRRFHSVVPEKGLRGWLVLWIDQHDYSASTRTDGYLRNRQRKRQQEDFLFRFERQQQWQHLFQLFDHFFLFAGFGRIDQESHQDEIADHNGQQYQSVRTSVERKQRHFVCFKEKSKETVC